jgi:hypothetical protein
MQWSSYADEVMKFFLKVRRGLAVRELHYCCVAASGNLINCLWRKCYGALYIKRWETEGQRHDVAASLFTFGVRNKVGSARVRLCLHPRFFSENVIHCGQSLCCCSQFGTYCRILLRLLLSLSTVMCIIYCLCLCLRLFPAWSETKHQHYEVYLGNSVSGKVFLIILRSNWSIVSLKPCGMCGCRLTADY